MCNNRASCSSAAPRGRQRPGGLDPGGEKRVGYRWDHGKWICLDWKTGEMKYAEKGVGKGSATYAEGMLYTLNSRHIMGVVEANPPTPTN